MNRKTLLRVTLEFIARLLMNAVKIAIGFSLAWAYHFGAGSLPQSNSQILMTIAILALVISGIETWMDWEVIPQDKKAAA
jgi:hypothetical protein